MAPSSEDSLNKELKITIESSPPPTPGTNRLSLSLTTPTTKEMHLSSSQAPTPTSEFDPSTTNPFSAFYSHPQTRTSFEQLHNSTSHLAHPASVHHSSSNRYLNASNSNVDLELGEKLPSYSRPSFDPSTTNNSFAPHKPCSVWPGKEHFKLKRKEMKRSRGCWPLRNLGKKQRRVAQAIIILLVIGIVVAAGVTITIKTNGNVYRSPNDQSPIG